MQSGENTSRKTGCTNGSSHELCIESQDLFHDNKTSSQYDKARKKMSNSVASGMNGLTRTNGLTNGGFDVLSPQGTNCSNGECLETSHSSNQGESVYNLTEFQESNSRVTNGELENIFEENDTVEEGKTSEHLGLPNSSVTDKPTENGYKGDYSNSEDETDDTEIKGNVASSRSVTNNTFSNDVPENGTSETVNGNLFMQNKSPKMQAARPKTISWSRMVKQRRDKKKKETNKKSQKSTNLGYLYPELCSSSDDEIGDTKCLNLGNKNSSEKSALQNCQNGAYKRMNNSSIRQNDSNNSESCLIDMCQHESDFCPVSTCQPGNFLSSSNECNLSSPITRVNANQRLPTLHNVDVMNSSFISAPLALPEDSDGYSSNSNDSNTQPTISSCPPITSVTTITTTALSCTTNSRTLITQTSQFIYTERTTIDNICFEEHRNLEQAMMPRAIPQNSSVDSLEEIGDYIETDFPNKDSRLLFQCSSRSSTSTEEDEGYGVNEVPQNLDLEPEGRSLPPESSFSLSHSCQNFDTNQLGSKVSGNAKFHECSNIDATSYSMQQQRISRLGSSTGRSESGSEIGGLMGSDSSVMYSPETDFMDFLEPDQPVQIGQNSSSLDLINPCMSNTNEHNKIDNERTINVVSQEFLDVQNQCDLSFVTNDLKGAEGGLTNDLNYDGRSNDFDPDRYNEMESYDPHLEDLGNENFQFHDICKHEKVPKANFKNSESNRQEKVFFKCAINGNHSPLSGSSDDEENLLHCMPREVMFNQERAPQNNEDTDCMGLEDLEHLTHALQNAVIMQLPSKLEESSGDSSEEPIYEDIDNIEHTVSSSDILPVLPEEPPKNSENVLKVLPKYERRKRRSHRSHSDVEKVMIWNEYEAYVLQVKQIGTSACGATAILNVLKAFDVQIDKEEVCKNVQTNLRMEAAPIPYYLFSRSSAGTTADNLIEGIERLTQYTIKGRFFHFYPSRKVELLKWLGYWIKKGAVPIATLNLQCGVKPGWTIPDAWHHQMVYGVSSKGVYLTNPLEIVPEEIIMEQLTSDSVLLIRRQDVVNRFRDWAPLNDILRQRESRWQTMNVLGQVVNVLREACTALSHQVPRYRAQLTSHISIPASYKAGITLFVKSNTDLCTEVFSTPELELRDVTDVPSCDT